MIKYMLDTNICIYVMKQRPESVFKHLQNCKLGEVGISAITLAELQFGVAKSNRVEENTDNLMKFVAPLEILDWPHLASKIYGQLRTELKKSGLIIGSLDMLIAAHALYCGVKLVTNNTKEFERIHSLNIEDWVQY